jgi:hypothetical protein
MTPRERKDMPLLIAVAIAVCIGVVLAVMFFGVGPD